MKTGIILEIDGHFLTVLTPDGEFLRARNERHPYKVGQEIEFYPFTEAENKLAFLSKWKSFKTKALIAAAMAILVGGASLIPVYKSSQVYAYMSIDDKSNIELAVNEDLKVIGINAYNQQGEEIVKKIDNWKNRDLSAVSSEILKEMEKQDLLDDKVVFSTTVNDDHEKSEQLKEEIKAIKKQANQRESSLVIVNGTKEERKKANEKGVTLGQFKQPKPEKKPKKSKNKQSQSQSVTTPTSEQKVQNQTEEQKVQNQTEEQKVQNQTEEQKLSQAALIGQENPINPKNNGKRQLKQEEKKPPIGNFDENKYAKKQDQKQKKSTRITKRNEVKINESPE